jgi:hypothetical protein
MNNSMLTYFLIVSVTITTTTPTERGEHEEQESSEESVEERSKGKIHIVLSLLNT